MTQWRAKRRQLIQSTAVLTVSCVQTETGETTGLECFRCSKYECVKKSQQVPMLASSLGDRSFLLKKEWLITNIKERRPSEWTESRVYRSHGSTELVSMWLLAETFPALWAVQLFRRRNGIQYARACWHSKWGKLIQSRCGWAELSAKYVPVFANRLRPLRKKTVFLSRRNDSLKASTASQPWVTRRRSRSPTVLQLRSDRRVFR